MLVEDTLIKVERSLRRQRQQDVLGIRQSVQRTMRAEIAAAAQELTGPQRHRLHERPDIDPDLACEIIVLQPDRPADKPRARQQSDDVPVRHARFGPWLMARPDARREVLETAAALADALRDDNAGWTWEPPT